MLNQYAVDYPTSPINQCFFPPHPVPAGMPSRSLEMPSRNNGPPSIWDTHVMSGNVFANPAASSQSPHPGGFNPLISKTSARNSVPPFVRKDFFQESWVHTQSDVHITLHGSRRATQCVCVARTYTIFMPSIDCLLVASSFCPSPVSLCCLFLLFLILPAL